MSQTPRPVVGFVAAAAAVLFGVIAVARHHRATMEAETAPVAAMPTRPKAVHTLRPPQNQPGWSASETSLEEGSGSESGPRAPAARPAPVARRADAQPGEQIAVPAVQPVPAEQNGAPQAAGEAVVASEAIPAPADKVGSAGGTSLSVNFDGSANAADQTPPLVVSGLEFDPSLNAGRFNSNAVLAYPDSGGIDPAQGTVALWVNMESDPDHPLIAKPLVELRTVAWENRFELTTGPAYLSFILTNSDGVEQGTGTPITWVPGQWRHIAVTWGQGLSTIYVDGAVMSESVYTGSVIIPPGTPLYVGSTRSGPRAGTVLLRGLRVFQQVLPPDQIVALIDSTASSQ